MYQSTYVRPIIIILVMIALLRQINKSGRFYLLLNINKINSNSTYTYSYRNFHKAEN